jgi:polyhydroxyalkanoate synthase
MVEKTSSNQNRPKLQHALQRTGCVREQLEVFPESAWLRDVDAWWNAQPGDVSQPVDSLYRKLLFSSHFQNHLAGLFSSSTDKAADPATVLAHYLEASCENPGKGKEGKEGKEVNKTVKDYADRLGSLLDGLRSHESDSAAGRSAREVIFQHNKLTLYHYLSPTSSQRCDATPVLIVYALVNRPTILDLQKGHSAIAKMLESGLDLYLVDWGYPDEEERFLGLDDYINGQLHRCIGEIRKAHSVDSINLLGVCQGGVLALCYSALHQEYVKNLVLMVTPVDFHTQHDTLSQWVRHVDIDLMVDTLGNIPGGMLSNAFLALRPYQLQIKKYLDLVDSMEKYGDNLKIISNFIAMEEWIFDTPDQAGETFRHFIKSCYQQNQLIKGELEIGGKCIDLKNLDIPILNIYAEQDHLVPPDASRALKRVVGGNDYEEMLAPGGHIGVFVTHRSLNRIFPAISEWIQARE